MGIPNLLQTIGPGVETFHIANLGSGKSDSPVSIQVRDLPCALLTNVDIYQPYMTYLQTQTFKTEVVEFVCRDVVLWLAEQEDKTYDILLLIDLLEHFKPSIARFFISCCKYVARRKVIIFLPLGNCPQEPYEGNEYQRHQSTWTSVDLETLGFRVEVLQAFHKHFSPPIDAGLAILEVGK